MKYTREKISSLMGHTEVIYKVEQSNFELIASPMGIHFRGTSPIVDDAKGLGDFAELVSRVWVDHQKLMPKILKPGEH